MSIATTFSVLFGLLIVLLVFNIPLVASIGLPTAIAMIASDMNFATLAQRVHASVDSFTMLAIPLFMLAGKLMEVGGMSRRIVDFADELVGWISGGLAHVMIISSAFFAHQ
jgi:C4-dicarboxylate transporter DctM subunit